MLFACNSTERYVSPKCAGNLPGGACQGSGLPGGEHCHSGLHIYVVCSSTGHESFTQHAADTQCVLIAGKSHMHCTTVALPRSHCGVSKAAMA